MDSINVQASANHAQAINNPWAKPDQGGEKTTTTTWEERRTRMTWDWNRAGKLTVENRTRLHRKKGVVRSGTYLVARSVNEEDRIRLRDISQESEVIAKYLGRKPIPLDQVNRHFEDKLLPRWERGEPKSAFTLFTVRETRSKSDPHETKTITAFAGFAVAGPGDNPGDSKLAVMLRTQAWGKGISRRMTRVLCQVYAPAVKAGGAPVFRGKPLERLVATASADDSETCSLMDQAHFKPVEPKLPVLDEAAIAEVPLGQRYNFIDVVKEKRIKRTAQKEESNGKIMVKYYFAKTVKTPESIL